MGNVTQVTDGNGNSTQYVYDGDNRPTVTINPQSNRTTTLYDKVGNVTQVTDSHNHATTFSYDADHRLTVSVDPLGNRTTTLYDKVGNVTQVTDANTYATTFAYDADNRLTVTTNALGGRTTTLYDAVGNVTEVDQAYSHSTTYLYDADNRVTVTTDGAGNQTLTFYDAVGNVTEVTDPRTYSTQYLYDADNHLTVTIDPLGGRTTTGFDSFGNIVSVTDPLNHSSGYTYDLLNREIGTSDSGGNSTNLLLDAVGNVTQVTDAVGNVTQFTYDSLNHVTEATDALSHNTTYSTYDTQGQLQATTDRDGNVHGFGYDADNRLNAETGEVVIGTTTYYTLLTYTYDADGDLLTAANPNGTYTFTYDHLDRVSTVREPFGVTLTFTYDLVGNRTGVQDSLGDVTTSLYDADNRLTSTQYSGPGVGGAGTTTLRIDLTYNEDSQIATETRYSDLAGTTVVGTATYDYDHADRLTTLIQDNGSGTVLASNTYSYDAAGRLTVEHDNGIPMTYTYDDANQVQADGVHTYTYDGTGNRTNTGYTTNADNELTSDGTWSYNYDDQGNLIGKVAGSISWDYGYDFLNHMVSAKEYTGATLTNEVDYKYDVFGNRIEKDLYAGGVGPPTVQLYAYDGWDPSKGAAVGKENFDVLADLNADHSLQTRYLRGDAVDQVFARVTVTWSGATATATPAWLLTDRLGSVREVTDASGVVIDTITYDAWGNATDSAAAYGGHIKWTGREMDTGTSDTGLQYNRDRYYDPKTARFTTQDPLGFAAGDLNTYRYAGNSPTAYTDPSGDSWMGLLSSWAMKLRPRTPPRMPPETTFLQDLYIGFGNVGKGAVGVVKNIVLAPIDSVATAYDAAHIYIAGTSTGYRPMSGYGQSSLAAQQQGASPGQIIGEAGLNTVTAGGYGLLQAANSGNIEQFQQATGSFGFGVLMVSAPGVLRPGPAAAEGAGAAAGELPPLVEPPGGATLQTPAAPNVSGLPRGAGTAANPPPSLLPAAGGQAFYGTPGGQLIAAPPGYVPVTAQNGNGLVLLPAGQALGNDANIIRYGDPNAINPTGYIRYYNAAGQPLVPSTGLSGPNAATHFPPSYQGPLLGYPGS